MFDGVLQQLYVDGNLEASALRGATGTELIFGSSSPVNVGSYGANAGTAVADSLFGRVDEAFVSSEILSDEKIFNLYCAKILHAIGNAFKALGDVLAPIKDAFRDIFPAMTGKRLADLTKRLEDFTKTLKPSPQTVEDLRRTFRGLFAILDIGKQILGGIFDVFRRVFAAIAGGTGSFLGITGSIGDFFVAVDKALKKGDGLENFFNGLGDWLVAPVKMVEKLKDAISAFFDSISPGGVGGAGSGLAGVFGAIGTAFGNMLEAFSHSDRLINGILDSLSQLGQAVGPTLSKVFSSIDWESILAVIRTGLLGGIVLMLRNFLGKGSFLEQIGFAGAGGGIVSKITAPFDALTGSVKAMQNQIKSKTIMEYRLGSSHILRDTVGSDATVHHG